MMKFIFSINLILFLSCLVIMAMLIRELFVISKIERSMKGKC